MTFRLSTKDIQSFLNDDDFNKITIYSGRRVKIKPELIKTTSNLSPHLQSFKLKLLSGNGFIVFKRDLKIFI